MRKCILIVESDPKERELYTQLIKRAMNGNQSVTILSAASAEKGLEIYKNHSINLVITAFTLTDTNGLTLTARIRELSATVSVIIMDFGIFLDDTTEFQSFLKYDPHLTYFPKLAGNGTFEQLIRKEIVAC